jgi:hypothetical protein
VIRALEAGQPAFTCFQPADIDAAYAIQPTKFDGVGWEMEHNPWAGKARRDAMQYLLTRAQIANAGNVAPAITPMVRIPPAAAAIFRAPRTRPRAAPAREPSRRLLRAGPSIFCEPGSDRYAEGGAWRRSAGERMRV